jgi:hypothetical protein
MTDTQCPNLERENGLDRITVRAELVEALAFLTAEEAQPFDTLRANGAR